MSRDRGQDRHDVINHEEGTTSYIDQANLFLFVPILVSRVYEYAVKDSISLLAHATALVFPALPHSVRLALHDHEGEAAAITKTTPVVMAGQPTIMVKTSEKWFEKRGPSPRCSIMVAGATVVVVRLSEMRACLLFHAPPPLSARKTPHIIWWWWLVRSILLWKDMSDWFHSSMDCVWL